MNYLYILDTNPLSELLFANFFSHFGWMNFVLLMISFAVQRLFSLISFHLFVFAFTFLAFGVLMNSITLNSARFPSNPLDLKSSWNIPNFPPCLENRSLSFLIQVRKIPCCIFLPHNTWLNMCVCLLMQFAHISSYLY